MRVYRRGGRSSLGVVLCGLFLATGVCVALSAARVMSSVTAGLVRRCTRAEDLTGLAEVTTVVLELRAEKSATLSNAHC